MHIRTIIMRTLENIDLVGYWLAGIAIAAAMWWLW